VAGLLLALWMAAAAPVQAQALIKQVPAVTSQVEGATTSQVVIEITEENENVSRGDVLGLIPAGTPLFPSTTGPGSSAIVVQRGQENEATIRQSGSGNEASITQRGEQAGSDGDNNVATLVQNGANNLGVIVHLGNQNRTTLTQDGNRNVAGVRLQGTNNATDILQDGTGNEYRLDFEGTGLGMDGTPHTVEQIGDQNMLVQVGQGTTPFNVQQRGDGMRMIIRRNVASQ
jgi:hypothetical protein